MFDVSRVVNDYGSYGYNCLMFEGLSMTTVVMVIIV